MSQRNSASSAGVSSLLPRLADLRGTEALWPGTGLPEPLS